MIKDEIFSEKLKADIAIVQVELVRFKLRDMDLTGEAKDRHDEHVAEMKLKTDQMNYPTASSWISKQSKFNYTKPQAVGIRPRLRNR